MRKISQSKAASLAGISRREFIEALSLFDIFPFQVTPEEFEVELKRGQMQLF